MDVMCLRADLLDIILALYPGPTDADPMSCCFPLLLFWSVMFDPGASDCWRSLAVLRSLLYGASLVLKPFLGRIMLLSECHIVTRSCTYLMY